MPRGARRLIALLSSRRLAASVLLAFVVFIVITTAVPRVPRASVDEVMTWKRNHPVLASVTTPLGLHTAYSSPLFYALVLLLAASTTACSWERTRAARMVSAKARDRGWIANRLSKAPTHVVAVPGGDPVQIIEGLRTRLPGMRLTLTDDGLGLTATRSVWAFWGSAFFHWSLVALICIAAAGYLLSWRGSIAAIVGTVRPLDYASTPKLSEGLLAAARDLPKRELEVESIDLDHVADGIAVGHAPLAIFREGGKTIERAYVYPNQPFHRGGLYLHRDDWGVGALVAFETTSGAEVGRTQLLFAFGTADNRGRITFSPQLPEAVGADRVSVTLPLDRGVKGSWIEDLPKDPLVELVLSTSSETTRSAMRSGDTLLLPGAGVRLRVVTIDRYARFTVVYDPTLGLVYVALVLVALSAAVALLIYPQVVFASVSMDEGTVTLRTVVLSKRVDALFRKRVEEAVRAIERGV